MKYCRYKFVIVYSLCVFVQNNRGYKAYIKTIYSTNYHFLVH